MTSTAGTEPGGGGRVVAAVDFSEISPAVVETARRAASLLGGEVLVVHAVEALQGGEERGPLLPSLRREVARLRDRARRDLEELIALGETPESRRVRAEILEGPAHRAVEKRSEHGASLVVVGCPHPGIGIASTAERIATGCRPPVLIVRKPPPLGYRKIVVGIDFSVGSEAAWRAAAALAGEGGSLLACHVLETQGDAADANARSESAARWLRRLPRGSDAACLLPSGNPRSALAEVARSEGADLLAVGRQGHGAITTLLLGSVAATAVRSAPGDVLVAGGLRGHSASG